MSVKAESKTNELIQKFESSSHELDFVKRKLVVAEDVINSNNLSCEYQAKLSLESKLEQYSISGDTLEAVIKLIEDIREEERKNVLKKKDKEIDKLKASLKKSKDKYAEIKNELNTKSIALTNVSKDLAKAEGKIRKLTASAKKDYTNSSKTSAQSTNRKIIHNGRKVSGRRPGGQKGRKHYGRQRHEPTQIVYIPPPDELASNDEYRKTGNDIVRQVVKIKLVTEVVEYRTPEYVSKKTGKRAHADFPEGVNDDVNYDGTVKTTVYLLNNVCNVSIAKTKRFLTDISGGAVNLSEGFISNVTRQFAKLTKDDLERLVNNLRASPVMHIDYTFDRVNGKLGTVFIGASSDRRYVLLMPLPNKSEESLEQTPAHDYDETTVSDHEMVFTRCGKRHQECLAHAIRHLKGSIDNEPELTWNKDMLKLLQEAIHYVNNLGEEEEADPEKVDEIIERYKSIIAKGAEEYEKYPIYTKYYREGYNLHKRMAQDMDDYILFLRDLSVPPTNNLAEQLARSLKRKCKVNSTFRSKAGEENFCAGLSIVESIKTAEREGGEHLYDIMVKIFNHDIESVIVPL